LTPIGLSNMAKRLYMQMFRVQKADIPHELFGAFHDYLDNRCKFSEANMMLKDFKAQHDAEVNAHKPACSFFTHY
jgi:hypothetical protein